MGKMSMIRSHTVMKLMTGNDVEMLDVETLDVETLRGTL